MSRRLCVCALEEARARLPAAPILEGLPHRAAGDAEAGWWASPDYYPLYAALASIVRPRAVLEVGVRLGYSLVALLRGHPEIARITGVDDESGVAGSMALALGNLKAAGWRGEPELLRLRSHQFHASWPVESRYDLAHVDGDHATPAAFLDVWECWRRLAPGGVLVVDDAGAACVRRAVEEARTALPDVAEESYVPTYTGWWLARKRAGP